MDLILILIQANTLKIMKYWENMNTDQIFDKIKEMLFWKYVSNLCFKESYFLQIHNELFMNKMIYIQDLFQTIQNAYS